MDFFSEFFFSSFFEFFVRFSSTSFFLVFLSLSLFDSLFSLSLSLYLLSLSVPLCSPKKNSTKNLPNSSFQERATKISHGNTALHAAEHGDKVLGKICAAIAGDEARHERAYQKIMDKLFELDPSGSMCAFSDMMQRQIVMPAHLMDDRSHGKSNTAAGKAANLFKDFSSVAQATGTYTGEFFFIGSRSFLPSFGFGREKRERGGVGKESFFIVFKKKLKKTYFFTKQNHIFF